MARKDEDTSWLDDAPDASADTSWLDKAPDAESASDWGETFHQRELENKPGMLRTAASGLVQGAMRDWGDEAVGGLNTAIYGGEYDENVARARKRFAAEEEANPATSAVTNFAGALGTAPMTLNPAAAGGIAFAEGAARSLGRSSQINKDAVAQAGMTGVQDAVLSALLTKYGAAAFDKLGSMTKPLVDKARNFAGESAVRALGRATPTQTRAMQDKDKYGYGVKDVGNWALENKILSPLASSEKMLERTRAALDENSKAMKPIYDAASTRKIDSEMLKREVLRRSNELAKDPGKVPQAEKLASYTRNIDRAAEANAVGPMGPQRQTYNPSDLAKFRGDVSKTINFNTDAVSQAGAQDMRRLLREKEMGLIEAKDPALRSQNEALFKNKTLGSRAEEVAERGAQQSQTNNRLGLTSYIGGGAVTSGLLATGMDAGVATGIGMAAGVGREILKRYGDQWSALTANKIANAASSETYRPLFEAALKRGGTAVAELHSQLLNDDPSYAGLFEGK